MSIKSIVEAAWPEILKVQVEAYSMVDLESLEVLKSKWLRSLESCFLYRDGESVVGYLLAHSWNSERPPKLFQKLPAGTEGPILFIHDLAISKLALGKGLGSRMIEHLLQIAQSSGYKQIRLVSVQGQLCFGVSWVTDQDVCSSYGEGAQLMCRVLQEQ